MCHGTGKIHSSAVIDEQVERDLSELVTDKGLKMVNLTVSPILGAYLSRGLSSFLSKWRRKYKCKVKVTENNDFAVLQYEFSNDKGEKLI